MIIKKYLNTSREEIASKKFNIIIGISLGNKYFTKENIKKYILWALENTKEDVLVVIADEIQAINLEVLDRYTKKRAEDKATRMGDELEKQIFEIILGLSKEKRKIIKIIRWKKLLTKNYRTKIQLIRKEFETNEKFHDFIIKIAKENPKILKKNLSEQELDSVAEYVIQELPLFITIEGLIPYPGLGLMDRLIMGLQNKTLFPELSRKLRITKYLRSLEAYVE